MAVYLPWPKVGIRPAAFSLPGELAHIGLHVQIWRLDLDALFSVRLSCLLVEPQSWQAQLEVLLPYITDLSCCPSTVLNPCQQSYDTLLLQVHQPVAYRIMAAAALQECRCFRSTAATVTHTQHCTKQLDGQWHWLG